MKKYHFDLIIANPPYGSIGTSITEQVIQNIDYNEYVNLLPANDSARGKDLYQHTVSMTVIDRGAFEDAAVTPAISVLAPNKVFFGDKLSLVILSKQAGLLEKYLLANVERGVPYIDYSQYSQDIVDGKVDPNCLLCLGHRDFANGHLPYTKNRDYEFNYGEIDLKTLLAQITHTYGAQVIWGSDLYTFSSKIERDNFRDFMYSADGFRFYSLVFTSAKVDSTDARLFVFPKVDWSRSWTPEEILVEYGYTEEEINQVMAKLEEFPGLKILD